MGAMGGQMMAGAFGAMEGFAGAKAQQRKLSDLRSKISDQGLLAFLLKFFPAAVAGGPFAKAFEANAASRNATTQSNFFQQMQQLLGQGQNGLPAQQGGLNASMQLAGNQGLNQSSLNLQQLQGQLASQAIPIRIQQGLANAGFGIGLGNTSGTLGGLHGWNQAMSAGGGGGGVANSFGGGGGGQSTAFGQFGGMNLGGGTTAF